MFGDEIGRRFDSGELAGQFSELFGLFCTFFFIFRA